MSASEGDRYRNVSGTTLFGLFGPDAVAEVRQVDPDDQDTAHHGTLVLAGEEDGDGLRPAAGLTEADLERDWEPVRSEPVKATKPGKGA